MKRNISLIAVLILYSISGIMSTAQNINANLKLNNDTIIIGDQISAKLNLKVNHADEIIFPPISDTLVRGIEILNIGEIEHSTNSDGMVDYTRKLLLTSFDTGTYVIPPKQIRWVVKSDTFEVFTDTAFLRVNPYINIDTVPRDTVFAKHTGSIVFGRNNFIAEIEQSISDSIRQSLSEEELKYLYDSIFQTHAQRFFSEVFNSTGLKDAEDISLIIGSPLKQLFIVDKTGIYEQMRVPGATDTIYVNEYDTVQKNQPLYVAFVIKDIDDTLYNTPLTFQELWQRFLIFLKKNWWWLLLIIAAITAGLIYLFRKKGINPLKIRLKPEEPPHHIALRELERIRIEKIWKHGKIKDYYTEITDVLRQYIERRYGIWAMEMTSDELLQSLSSSIQLSTEDHNKLKQILELSNLVKFAKFEPQNYEHDLILKLSKEFVENTLIEEETPNKIKPVEAEIELNKEPEIEENKE
jgi:hypothetical protein